MSVKDQTANISGFGGHLVSFTTAQLCLHSAEVVMDNKQGDGHGCIPRKLNCRSQVAGRIWPVDRSLPNNPWFRSLKLKSFKRWGTKKKKQWWKDHRYLMLYTYTEFRLHCMFRTQLSYYYYHFVLPNSYPLWPGLWCRETGEKKRTQRRGEDGPLRWELSTGVRPQSQAEEKGPAALEVCLNQKWLRTLQFVHSHP